MAKSGFVFFNYKSSQVIAMPEEFRAKFDRVNWVG
jgi:acyl-CoA thioesterase FadM